MPVRFVILRVYAELAGTLNFLAHSSLASPDEDLVIGAFLGDFVRGSQLDALGPLERGVRLHRFIDSYSDAHYAARATRSLFSPPHRRYAGLILDIYFDHLLARNYPNLHGEALGAFSERVWEVIEPHMNRFPTEARAILKGLRRRGFLASYASSHHARAVLRSLSARLRQPDPLSTGWEAASRHHEAIASAFAMLYPDVRTAVAQWEAANPRIANR